MSIQDLEDIISDALTIPAIDENDAVCDGSFNTTPWAVETLNGNGCPVHITDHVAVNLFYINKNDAISAVHELLPILASNNVVVQMPEFNYQEGGRLWMATLNVQY